METDLGELRFYMKVLNSMSVRKKVRNDLVVEKEEWKAYYDMNNVEFDEGRKMWFLFVDFKLVCVWWDHQLLPIKKY